MTGFGGLSNMFDLMKNAKQMMEKAKIARDDLANVRVEGSAGAGLVTVVMNGLGELLSIDFDKSVVNPDDTEMLAELVVGAVADARRKVADSRASMFEKVSGGLDLSAMGIGKSMFF